MWSEVPKEQLTVDAGPEPPATDDEAFNGHDASKWCDADQEELDRLKECGTYVLVDRPQGARVLQSRFVRTLKKDSQGRIVRYKSRLVVKGFMQRPGVDFSEVFAPTSRQANTRMLLALAAAKDWEVH
ncbi:hypothetical protein AXG93_1998s1270 [Marchantia polymorpha subsp. ruderalis]|uniref:Reverse transcriptase Ty1/copia-type domain-containing protein n=1 Tax=Marchantia polymorpha subsp. ruderalis TaxID=1480154 RepID=A0A176VMQ1_MARPO|nr:hypothetical protein AXG93_1998s1270 [Marchantia polymorpha subsp. ruderalis]